jgi:hypothetical protein
MLSNTAYQAYKHRESAARGFQVLPSSDTTFLITTSRGIDHIVHLPPSENTLLQGSCSCGKYQEYRSPCAHAIACIQYLSKDPYSYFSLYYTWEVSKRTYQLPLRPITLQGLLPLPEHQLLPPVKKAKRGRPKVARIRTNYKVDKHIYHCSVCQQPGHNRRICPNQPVEHGRAQRARDRLIEGKHQVLN